MFPTFCLLQDIQTRAIIGRGTKRRGLYYVEDVAPGRVNQVRSSYNNKTKTIWLWHRRLGHASFVTQHGLRWFVIFVDDCTRMTWLYTMKQKSDVGPIFQQFYRMIGNQFSLPIKVLRSDNDEYRWFDMPLELSNGRVEINQENNELAASTQGSGPIINPCSDPCINSGPSPDPCIECGEHDVGSLGNPSADPHAVFEEHVAECSIGPTGEPLTRPINGPELFGSARMEMDGIEAAAGPANNNPYSPLPVHAHVPEDIQEVHLEEEVYMDFPPGYEVPNGGGKVCKLRKALNGLKQSPRAWFGRFTQVMKSYGYKQGNADHTLFIKRMGGKVTLLIIYVDDMVVTGDDTEEIKRLQSYLSSEFEMKDPGGLKYLLEMCPKTNHMMILYGHFTFTRSRDGIYLCQRKYVLDLLSETGMLACFKPRKSMLLYCDNQAAREIANNLVQHDRTKHVEVDRHFIKEKLEVELIDIPSVKSEEQLADVLTHVMSVKVFQDSLDKLGLGDIYAPT
ncbi:hypothetical protein D8674_019178 [Pyrus ussuriensis x Pyrus communis]|uniref:Reverse transcriptase Ty1/copia-type domain-containing protein n=1 Tax=Pyrus ussuriensis x Pyrus communis TaxID=2448454 RepID=A0A5N5G704_9ROSA|nr:hypothetical protein D8674_019178 [Pyrus ussuriensis x Pyrus communis]